MFFLIAVKRELLDNNIFKLRVTKIVMQAVKKKKKNLIAFTCHGVDDFYTIHI